MPKFEMLRDVNVDVMNVAKATSTFAANVSREALSFRESSERNQSRWSQDSEKSK